MVISYRLAFYKLQLIMFWRDFQYQESKSIAWTALSNQNLEFIDMLNHLILHVFNNPTLLKISCIYTDMLLFDTIVAQIGQLWSPISIWVYMDLYPCYSHYNVFCPGHFYVVAILRDVRKQIKS